MVLICVADTNHRGVTESVAMWRFSIAVIVWLPFTGTGYQPMVSYSALSAYLTTLLECLDLVHAVLQLCVHALKHLL